MIITITEIKRMIQQHKNDKNTRTEKESIIAADESRILQNY